jgi:hypothetical protein
MASNHRPGCTRSRRHLPPKRSLVWIAAILIVVCNLIDIASTIYIISLGGQELNPLAAFLLQYNLLWPFKVSIVGWIALGAWLSRHEPMRARVRLMWAVACVYVVVVAWNVIPLLLYLTS